MIIHHWEKHQIFNNFNNFNNCHDHSTLGKASEFQPEGPQPLVDEQGRSIGAQIGKKAGNSNCLTKFEFWMFEISGFLRYWDAWSFGF